MGDHNGWKGKYSSDLAVSSIPYWSNSSTELVFHTPMVIEEPIRTDQAIEAFLGMLTNDFVFVVWTETIENLSKVSEKIMAKMNNIQPDTYPGLIHLYIHPVHNANGLYLIRIITFLQNLTADTYSKTDLYMVHPFKN